MNVGYSAVGYSQLCNRTECNYQDTKLALSEMGIKVTELYQYCKNLIDSGEQVNLSAFEFGMMFEELLIL